MNNSISIRVASKIIIDFLIFFLLIFIFSFEIKYILIMVIYTFIKFILNGYHTFYSFFNRKTVLVDLFAISISTLFSFFILNLTFTNVIVTSGSFYFLFLFGTIFLSYFRSYSASPTGFKIFKRKFLEKVLIVGAGQTAKVFLENDYYNFHYIGIFDENKNLHKKWIFGIPIIGDSKDLLSYLKKNSVDTIVFTTDPDNKINNSVIKNIYNKYPAIKLYSLSSLSAVQQVLKPIYFFEKLNQFIFNRKISNINIHEKDLKKISKKTILITGGAGSIGSEIVNKLFSFNSKLKIIILDINEYGVYKIKEKYPQFIKSKNLTLILGDYGDDILVDELMKIYKPELIYHAAAFKHVNILQNDNIYSAIYNNCIKSIKFAKTILKFNSVKKIILVSTDKAVNPISIMGISKRIVEISFNKIFYNKKINLMTVRFGNVIGSNGSVFDKFINQIINKQKITLTNKNVTRYFMNIADAATLIIKISTLNYRNKIFILNMGKPIYIYNMIKNLILKFGDKSQVNDIVIIGLQDGEKISEELYYDEEKVKAYDNSIFIGTTMYNDFDPTIFLTKFEELKLVNDKDLINFISKIKLN